MFKCIVWLNNYWAKRKKHGIPRHTACDVQWWWIEFPISQAFLLLLIIEITVDNIRNHDWRDVLRNLVHSCKKLYSIGCQRCDDRALIASKCIALQMARLFASISHLQAELFWRRYAFATAKCARNYSCISRFIFHFATKSLGAWELKLDDIKTLFFLAC